MEVIEVEVDGESAKVLERSCWARVDALILFFVCRRLLSGSGGVTATLVAGVSSPLSTLSSREAESIEGGESDDARDKCSFILVGIGTSTMTVEVFVARRVGFEVGLELGVVWMLSLSTA